MAQLISAEDELGAIFHKKLAVLMDEAGEEVAGEALELVGIRTFYYDGLKRDFFELGVVAGAEAASRGTNLVLTWDAAADSLVAFFAQDREGAERLIKEARAYLVLERSASRARKPARKGARSGARRSRPGRRTAGRR